MKATFFSVSAACLAISTGFGQSVEKAIPIEQEQKPQTLAYRQGNVSVTVDPATAASQPMDGGVTNSLQQQMHLVVVQAITPWLSLAYGAGAGFRTQEIQLLRQTDQASAYLNMLNRPALDWKPREGIEVEAAYQTQENLSDQLAADHNETATLQGKMKVNPKTTVGFAYSQQKNTAANGDETGLSSTRLTSEYAMSDSPITLQLNPGYETATAVDSTQAIRAFVENAVIYKVDSNTTLTVGSGFAGGRNNPLSESGYFLVQHVVLPGTALELRAAMLNADRNMPGQGFAVSAGSTVALAQALSAGLSVRYKMDENPIVDRPKNETFLSLSINGRF
ncbi:MAG: hypothetical protein ABIT76_15350 [Chthoniobacterales bacterium]